MSEGLFCFVFLVVAIVGQQILKQDVARARFLARSRLRVQAEQPPSSCARTSVSFQDAGRVGRAVLRGIA